MKKREVFQIADGGQRRNWFITINNYTPEEYQLALDYPSRYSIVCKEVGAKKGVPHIHAYYELEKPLRFNTLKTAFPRANIQYRKGKADQARKYIMKHGDYTEKGEPTKQGKRTDLEEAAEKVRDRIPLREIAIEHPSTFVRYFKGLEAMQNILFTDRTDPPVVTWLWGTTGVGKTRYPHDTHGAANVYIKDSTQWWNGYTQQTAIVIDDFDIGKWPYRDLLRLLDRYAYQGQTKGGYVKINSPYIYITCSHPPEYCWSGDELNQIRRRLTRVEHMLPTLVLPQVITTTTTTTEAAI